MKKKTISVCLGLLVWCLPLFVCLPTAAEQASSARLPQSKPAGVASEEPEEVISPGVVVIEGRTILTVYESVGTFTAEQRASGIVTRIISFAAKGGSPDAIRLQSHDAWTEIFLDNVYMMAVTDADARMAGKAREQLLAIHPGRPT
jgi:hypothetical protein